MTDGTSQLKGRVKFWREIANSQSIRLKTREAKLHLMQKELNVAQRESNSMRTERESEANELNGGLEHMRGEIIKLKSDQENLRNEKAGKFNEYKLLYDAEVTALGKLFEAEVQEAANIMAKATATAQVQELEGEIEILKGENTDLVSLSEPWHDPC
jgi:inorganic triphosphatase YgiF